MTQGTREMQKRRKPAPSAVQHPRRGDSSFPGLTDCRDSAEAYRLRQKIRRFQRRLSGWMPRAR